MTMPMYEGGPSVLIYLKDKYSEEPVSIKGAEGTFNEVLDLEEAFCPVEPDQQDPLASLEYLEGMLIHALDPEDAARIKEIKSSLEK